MADMVYRADDRTALPMQTDWGAIWSGLFTFICIWAVFDLLGYAIFPRAANGGIAWGIWSIVLAAIAMFVAGRVTGTLAALTGSTRVWHGMIMFGLSVAGAIILMISGSSLLAGFSEPGTMTRGVMPSLFPQDAWIAFGTLFLGWLGAMFGASSAAAPKSEMASNANIRQVHPAA